MRIGEDGIFGIATAKVRATHGKHLLAASFLSPEKWTAYARLAETSAARFITTHDLRHLRPAKEHGVTVLPPREFLRILAAQP